MHIGILQTGRSPDQVRDRLGDYDDMFVALLAPLGFTFTTWAVLDGAFPDGPDAAEGWLITGSRHGAYEQHDWIAPLERLIRDIMAADIPLIGVCFGHQIIAQALGGTVEKFSGGWSVGRQEYRFDDGRTWAVNAWHQDQVTKRPDGAKVVAASDFCANAALLYDRRAYTIQPHPEFGAEMIAGLLSHRAPGVVPEDLQTQARDKLDQPADQQAIAGQFARFFRERRIT